MQLPKLNFPQYAFHIKERQQNNYIFDTIRRKYITLTPEEWVRQHVLQYLREEKHYPAGLLGVEKGFRMNTLHKRTDVVVYNRNGKPAMLIECKAPEVKIDQKVLEQASTYNLKIDAPYLLLTNGLQHFCLYINLSDQNHRLLKQIPDFETVNAAVD